MMRVAALGLLACWLVAHAWILQTYQFTYEDAIYQNQAMSSATPPPIFRHVRSLQRGLTDYTLWWQFHLAPSPVAHRIVNLILSVTVAGLVGLLAIHVGLSPWIAALPMLLHPFLTETLASVAGRAELLAACGLVGAVVWALWVSLRPPPLWGVFVASLGSVALLWLSVLAKPTAGIGVVLVPLVMLSARPRWRIVSLGALSLGIALAGAAMWQIRGLGEGPYTTDPLRWAHLQGAAVFRHLTLMAWPWPPAFQTVDYDYDHLSPTFLMAAWVGLSALVVGAVSLWKSHRYLSLGLWWMLIVGVPRVIVREPRAYVSEHGMYLALVGLSLMLTAWLSPRHIDAVS